VKSYGTVFTNSYFKIDDIYAVIFENKKVIITTYLSYGDDQRHFK